MSRLVWMNGHQRDAIERVVGEAEKEAKKAQQALASLDRAGDDGRADYRRQQERERQRTEYRDKLSNARHRIMRLRGVVDAFDEARQLITGDDS